MNIFDIKSTLSNIFAEIQDNDGELTPELEAELRNVQESLQDKVEGCVSFIKNIDNDINLINAEIARLKLLKNKREKLKGNIERVLIETISELGDTKKSGVKFIDYGTGEVSLRKSQSIIIDESVANKTIDSLAYTMHFLKQNNELNTYDKLDARTLIDYVNNESNIFDAEQSINITEDDLHNMSAELTFKFPIDDLFDGKAYNVYRQLLDYTNDYKIKASINKSELKKTLQENGSAAPNLAKLSNNLSLTIK